MKLLVGDHLKKNKKKRNQPNLNLNGKKSIKQAWAKG